MPESSWKKMGQDILISVEGGASHIGTCVMAQPYLKPDGSRHVTLNVLNRLYHKDDVIASMYAKRVCQETGTCVVCVCGIHYDDYSPELLDKLMNWAVEDIQNMVREIQTASHSK